MQSPRPLLNVPAEQLPRLAVFMSGSGTNAAQLLTRVAASGDSAPLQVVALVTDAPETSRTRELGKTFDLPVVANDIRAFYREHGETRVSIGTPAGQRLRSLWTDALREQLAPFQVDFGVFAGFVPLTNITDDFPCLNVHPGDLTYRKDGQRYLVGLHTVPIERAMLEGQDSLRSSVIIAIPYSGKGDDMDSGPILGISTPVPIDFDGATLDQLQACAKARPEKRPKGGYADRLEQVAKLNQEALKRGGDWVVLPPVVFDFARGCFGQDADGQLHYRMAGRWHPVETVVYGVDGHEVVFRSARAETGSG